MKDKRLVVVICSIVTILMVAFSVSVAYFVPNIANQDSISVITVTGAEISLTLTKGTTEKTIVGDSILPGWSDTKSFKVTVSNNSGEKIKYELFLNYMNEFTANEIVYTLTGSGTGAVSISDKVGLGKSLTYTNVSLGEGSFAGDNSTTSHEYTLTLSYEEKYSAQSQNNYLEAYVSLAASGTVPGVTQEKTLFQKLRESTAHSKQYYFMDYMEDALDSYEYYYTSLDTNAEKHRITGSTTCEDLIDTYVGIENAYGAVTNCVEEDDELYMVYYLGFDYDSLVSYLEDFVDDTDNLRIGPFDYSLLVTPKGVRTYALMDFVANNAYKEINEMSEDNVTSDSELLISYIEEDDYITIMSIVANEKGYYFTTIAGL